MPGFVDACLTFWWQVTSVCRASPMLTSRQTIPPTSIAFGPFHGHSKKDWATEEGKPLRFPTSGPFPLRPIPHKAAPGAASPQGRGSDPRRRRRPRAPRRAARPAPPQPLSPPLQPRVPSSAGEMRWWRRRRPLLLLLLLALGLALALALAAQGQHRADYDREALLGGQVGGGGQGGSRARARRFSAGEAAGRAPPGRARVRGGRGRRFDGRLVGWLVPSAAGGGGGVRAAQPGRAAAAAEGHCEEDRLGRGRPPHQG